MKNKLAIFDLDGTLFDTRHVNFLAYQQVLKEEGFELEEKFYEKECNGKYYKDYLPLLIENPSQELMERIHKRKKKIYSNFLSYAVENTHLFEIIKRIKEVYNIALVTTASRENCNDIITHFKKHELFQLIITQNDVSNVKPNPEGFLKAIEYFNVTPENTLIFEDSASGIEAGKRSGAKVLAVLDFIDN